MQNTAVSVIIPVYNVEKYLRLCLDSVINQTFKNIEIIIVNDCSPDNSAAIIEEYRKKDDRFVLISLEKNLGLGEARNEGIKIAKGKYIVFIDSDDWVKENYIEILYKNIEQHGCDFVSANFYAYDDKIKKLYGIKPEADFCNVTVDSLEQKQRFLSLELIHYVWKYIYRRDFLFENDICFTRRTMEDVLFTYKAVIDSKKFMVIDEKIYYHRFTREDSIMMILSDRPLSHIDLLKDIKNLLISKNLYDIYKISFLSFAIHMFIFIFDRSNLGYKQLTDIFNMIKKDFFEGENIKFYKKNKFYLNIKIYLWNFSIRYNINYVIISKLWKIF